MRPPFGGRIFHKPKEGELVLFPPWLTHGVTPTSSLDPRVSISFNLMGDWTKTGDTNFQFEQERSLRSCE